MKKTIRHLIATVLLFSSLSVSAVSVLPSDIFISPTPPTASDFLSAQISGVFITPGFTLDNTPLLNISGNLINISFQINSPTGPVIQVLAPFTYNVDLGLLNAGIYSITADFYIDRTFDSAIKSQLNVSAVPVPAAAWLFISGILAMLSLRRFNLKS